MHGCRGQAAARRGLLFLKGLLMTTYCGYIAIVGRPNVGKSTLLNQILKQKLSITSRKAQTTRHSILGIDTRDDTQFVYVDTPGIHQGSQKAMNRMMNKTAMQVLKDVDCVVFVLEGTRFLPDDEMVLGLIQKASVPCVLVLNKIDKIDDKETLLPFIQMMSEKHKFDAIIPISARTGLQVDALQNVVKAFLPEGPHLFDSEQFTDRPIRFLCAELVREKIFRLCGEELPYSTSVEIESYEDEGDLIRIHALVWVEKETHKRMIIGDKGLKMKDIATQARLDMERLLGKKVFLHAYCKVKAGWGNDERILKQFGYDND